MDAATREYVRAVRDAVVGERWRRETTLNLEGARKYYGPTLGYDTEQLPTKQDAYGRREGETMALAGSAKELKPLLDAIKENGFKVVPAGKHHKVVDVEGKLGAKNKVVTDDNGPIIISSTPGDFRARDMHVKRLRDAHIIKRDPWAVDKGEGKADRKTHLTDPAVQERKREAIAEESRRRQQRTQQLRARLEPIIAKIGGWDKPGIQAELGKTAFHYLEKRGRTERWKTESGAIQNTRQLRLGNTLSDQSVDAWNLVCEELEKAWRKGVGTTPNDDALRERWFEMVRDARGLPPAEAAGPPANGVGAAVPLPTARVPLGRSGNGGRVSAPADPAEDAPDDDRHARVGPLHEQRSPRLALRAMGMMARAADTPDRMDEAMEVAEMILDLELKGRE